MRCLAPVLARALPARDGVQRMDVEHVEHVELGKLGGVNVHPKIPSLVA